MAYGDELKTQHDRPSGFVPSVGSIWCLPAGGALLTLLIVAFVLRVYLLAGQSIWFDEAITLDLATSSFSEIAANRAANTHPPLYFFLMKVWVTFVGLDPFVVRYASVLGSFLQVPTIFLVARHLFSRRAAWIAAILVALSPLSIIYAQEVRVYAFLPLVYLALLFLAYMLARSQSHAVYPWVILTVVAVVGLHLHYIVVFAVAYTSLWLLWRLWRRRRWQAVRRWMFVQLAVVFSMLPWMIVVIRTWWIKWYGSEQGIPLTVEPVSRVLTDPVPRSYLVEQLWSFQLTGLAGVIDPFPVPILAGASAVLILALFIRCLRKQEDRNTLFFSATHWLLPLLGAFSLWSIRSYSHPRYVIVFSGAFFLWLAYMLAPTTRSRQATDGILSRSLRATLLGTILLLSVRSLYWYYFDPEIGKKPDIRGVAHYLENRARLQDVILAPYQDHSLRFEYHGDTPVRMPELESREEMWHDLERWTTPPRTVHLVSPAKGSLDWQDVVPFALEAAGTKIASRRFDGLTLHSYRLDQPVIQPVPTKRSVGVEGLQMAGSWVEPAVPAGSAVPVALEWHRPSTSELSDRRYGISLSLHDADGWMLAQQDELLLNADGQPTALWAEHSTMTYHLLPLPLGTPPLSYTVRAAVYDLLDEEIESVMVDNPLATLGRTQLVRAGVDHQLYRDAAPVPSFSAPQTVARGLDLLGVHVDRDVVAPGETIFVTLRWQATTPALPRLNPEVSLVQGEAQIGEPASAPTLARYPTTRWQQGEVVTEYRSLTVAPNAAGPAIVQLSLHQKTVPLAQVEVAPVAHQFEPPPVSQATTVAFGNLARLVGYDLPATVVPTGQTFTVTLHWRALATGSDRPYTVFVHLVTEDGKLVAQHDSPPVQGQRPLTGWVQGEYIADSHTVTFHDAAYTGPARLAVGLYDPESGERLPTPAGDDMFFLPDMLQITLSQ